MMKPTAVVLASGGMDSCVATAMAAEEYAIAMLHCNYGQRTETRELQAFTAIADHYKVAKRLVVSMDHLSQIGGSSLTDRSIPVEEADLERKEIPTSYVPFRNANILAVAVSWAEVLDARAIVIGAVEEDSSGYPDCRREFYDAFSEVVKTGTKPSTQIAILTPLIALSKAEIVRQGVALHAPLHATWSCYRNSEKACGVCDSCALRLRGFQAAGVEDPLPYLQRPNYLLHQKS
jgi:7-cyano-7-deazaguanine synthase